jgi:hypothetical protein
MTANTLPQIRTFSVMMVLLTAALIIDLNLKNVSFEHEFCSLPHQWLGQALAAITNKLASATQPSPSSEVSASGSEALARLDPNRGPGLGLAAVVQSVDQNKVRRIRLCVAPAAAQFGQGNSVQPDYGTPVRNALVLLMSGPALDVAALDANLPVQMDAEARQKQCDYILISSVTVRRAASSGLNRLMKAGGMAASLTPMGLMAHSVGGIIAAQAASTAMQTAALSAQQQALTQLSGFNSQVKSKDEVTVQYQLLPTGQSQPRMQNLLKGKSRTDGEDVLSPLLRDAANGVVNELVKSAE